MRTPSDRWSLVVDAALAAGLAAVCVFQGLDDQSGHWREFDGTGILLSVLATVPTAARRRAPVAVLLICYVFWVWQMLAGYNPVVTTYGVLLAMYTVAATQPTRRTAVLLSITPVCWITAGVITEFASMAGVILTAVFVPAVIWKAGDSAKQLHRTNRLLIEANAQLHRDREERARRAVTDERVRIARELHDVVAHHMSVVAVQAGLARYVLRGDPDTADAALGTVLATSAEALDEMRRILSLLRVHPEEEIAAASLAGLPALFERVRAAGVPVRVEVSGEARPLPSGFELCIYRIVQESLTNVLKHAAPATATVTLVHGGHRFSATVRDDGDRPVPDTPGGHGLIGMRERATLYGGTLDATRLPGGGFEVRLSLPLPAAREEGDDPVP